MSAWCWIEVVIDGGSCRGEILCNSGHPSGVHHPPQMQACHLLAAMWKGGPSLAPDTVSYNTLLKAFTNASQLAKAVQAYQEMVHRWGAACSATQRCSGTPHACYRC